MTTLIVFPGLVTFRFTRLVVSLLIIGTTLPLSAQAGAPAHRNHAAFLSDNNCESRLKNRYRFAKHIVKSHTVDLAKAPASSVVNLLSLTVETGVALVNRADIRFRRTPLLNQKSIPALSHGESMDMIAWEQWLDRHVQIPETGGSIEYLIGGESFYGRLNEAIEQAEESILMQTYIFDNDDVAQEVADALKKKSQDCDIRLLYDGMGTIMAESVAASSRPLVAAMPGSIHAYLKADNSRVRVRRIHNSWLAGDHIKNTVIDHQVAFLGGMNIGREYRYDWHDMMVEIQGPAVGVLENIFESSWDRNRLGDLELLVNLFKSRKKPVEAGTGIRFLQTAPWRMEIAEVQLEAIRRARSYIFIENAYFSDDQFVHELCSARKRGVDVRVIIPLEGNHGIMQTSNKISVNRLLENGVTVYQYPGMSHVKAAVFDGWACIGTANYDKMSLRVNRELNIGISDPRQVQRLIEELFIPDMEKSIEVDSKADAGFFDYVVELFADEA